MRLPDWEQTLLHPGYYSKTYCNIFDKLRYNKVSNINKQNATLIDDTVKELDVSDAAVKTSNNLYWKILDWPDGSVICGSKSLLISAHISLNDLQNIAVLEVKEHFSFFVVNI